MLIFFIIVILMIVMGIEGEGSGKFAWLIVAFVDLAVTASRAFAQVVTSTTGEFVITALRSVQKTVSTSSVSGNVRTTTTTITTHSNVQVYKLISCQPAPVKAIPTLVTPAKLENSSSSAPPPPNTGTASETVQSTATSSVPPSGADAPSGSPAV